MEKHGIVFRPESKPCGYNFNNNIDIENIVNEIPTVNYYWADESRLQKLHPGYSYYSAGPAPKFYSELQDLLAKHQLKLKKEDIEIIKQMLLFVVVGEKNSFTSSFTSL